MPIPFVFVFHLFSFSFLYCCPLRFPICFFLFFCPIPLRRLCAYSWLDALLIWPFHKWMMIIFTFFVFSKATQSWCKKMQFPCFPVLQGSAESLIRQGGKLYRLLSTEHSCQKLLKSINTVSSYSQKCLGSFLRHTVHPFRQSLSD